MAQPPTLGRRRRSIQSSAVRGRPAGVGLWLLAALWMFVLFEPQWLVATYGIRVLLKAPTLLYLAVGATVVVGVPNVQEWRRRWTWYPPFLAFVAICVVTGPFAPNGTLAKEWTQFYFLMWVLIVATVALVDSARRAELLLLVYGLQFLWWAAWGDSTGRVYWHTTLGNFDAFGSFLVMGAGLCAFLITAVDRKWLRSAMILSVPLCVIGVVASFARGAAIGAVVVFGLVWLRSPRKGRMFAVTILAGGLVVATETALHGGAYWTELATIAQGTDEGTGEDRWEMWRAAGRVFQEHPFFGVGAGNWGVAASELIRPGELGGRYEFNPGAFYGRSTHNSYVQIMAEQGIAGLLALAWILVDFWRRNAALRTAAAQKRWHEIGGRLRLRFVSYAIEAALVGWLCAASLYSQGGKHWLYSVLALNLLFHSLAVSSNRHPAASGPATRLRRAPGPYGADSSRRE